MIDPKDNNINPDTSKTETLTGTIENSNDYILNNIGAYLEYIRENIKQIIINDGLKYSDPKDKKKEYPDFTYTQFLYLLSRLYDNVYSVNLELLHDPAYYNYNNNKKPYNIDKVKKAYDVYLRLCNYYGFNCTPEPFLKMIGMGINTLKEWLSSGRSDLLKIMQENAKNDTISRFENSTTPLLNLAAGNYKYKLNEAQTDNTPAGIIATLPDLLSLPDAQKALIDKKPE